MKKRTKSIKALAVGKPVVGDQPAAPAPMGPALSSPAPLSQHGFGGKNGEEENALFSAITTAASMAGFTGVSREYDWLEQSPRASLVVELVDALHMHGYRIMKENTDYATGG